MTYTYLTRSGCDKQLGKAYHRLFRARQIRHWITGSQSSVPTMPSTCQNR